MVEKTIQQNDFYGGEISDKLFDLMHKEKNDSNPSAKVTKRLDELLNILMPLIPQQYSSNIRKFTRLIKIAQAINATDDILTNPDTNFIESSDTLSADSELKRESGGNPLSIENSNAGSLDSLDMIAKVVQLLS